MTKTLAHITADADAKVSKMFAIERAVLGAILLDPEAIDATGQLAPHHFEDVHYATIFGAIKALHTAGKPVDILTVSDRLKTDGNSERVGGSYAVGELTNYVASSANVEYHAKRIIESWMRRRLVQDAETIKRQAIEGGDPFDILDALVLSSESYLEGVAQSQPETIQEIAAREHKVRATRGDDKWHTGLKSFDDIHGGIGKGEMHVIAGRPGTGKTAFEVTAAINMARQGHPVCICSMEMSKEQMLARIESNLSGIPARRIYNGDIRPHEREAHEAAKRELYKLPIEIDDLPAHTSETLAVLFRRWSRKYTEFAVCIDYLSLMSYPKGMNKNEGVGNNSMAVRELIRTYGVHGIVLQQMNRGVEGRTNGRPTLSDLRDSGQIEQDAWSVTFLHGQRPEGESPDAWPVYAIVEKNRDGKQGDIELTLNGKATRFEEPGKHIPQRPPLAYEQPEGDDLPF